MAHFLLGRAAPKARDNVAEHKDDQSARLALAFDRHSESLRNFLAGILKDWNTANDAVQATFVRALEATDLEIGDDFRGWLFRVGFHEAMALRRKERTRENAHERLAWLVRRAEGTREDSKERSEELARLRHLVERLPHDEQWVIRQRIELELTFAEIAEKNGIPLGTVLTRMRRSLQRLRMQWNQINEQDSDRE